MIDHRDYGFFQVWDQQKLHHKWRLADLRSGAFSLLTGLTLIGFGLHDSRIRVVILFGALTACFGLLSLAAARYSWKRECFRVCGTCGYNMTGNKSGRCPECGALC